LAKYSACCWLFGELNVVFSHGCTLNCVFSYLL